MSRELAGHLMMLVVAGCFAVTLVGLKLAGSGVPLLWLSAWTRLGIGLVSLFAAVIFHRALGLNRRLVFALTRSYCDWRSGLAVFSYFDYMLLALAFRHAEEHVVAVVYEAWPVLLMLVVSAGCRGRYRSVEPTAWLGILLSVIGIYLTTGATSKEGLLWLFSGLRGEALPLLFSMTFPLAAAVLTAFTGFSWVMVAKAAADERVRAAGGGPGGEAGMLVFLLVFCNFGCAALSSVLGAVFHGPSTVVPSRELLLWGLLVAGGGCGVAAVVWRLASALASGVSVHAVSYVTPVFTLLIFGAMGMLSGVSPSLLWTGVMLVVVGNLGFVVFRPRVGFRSRRTVTVAGKTS